MKRSLSVAVIGAVALVSAVLVGTTPAYAKACAPNQVTVVVQFPDRTEVGCTNGDPSDGFEALRMAGFEFTRVQRFGAALCSINSYPRKECIDMPPANAYWKYWHASPGGDWESSTRGAAAWNPAPGSVEGWRFGSDAAPDTDPPEPNPPTPPSPTTSPTKSASGKPTTRPGGANTTSATVPSAAASATATATATPKDAAPSSPQAKRTTAAVVPTPEREVTDSAAPTSLVTVELEEDQGSSNSWIWGLGLLLVLGLAGGIVQARRKD